MKAVLLASGYATRPSEESGAGPKLMVEIGVNRKRPNCGEKRPLEQLAAAGQLAAFRHAGFWQLTNPLRDKNMLKELWQQGPLEGVGRRARSRAGRFGARS